MIQQAVNLSHTRLVALMLDAFHQRPQEPLTVKQLAEIIIKERYTVSAEETKNLCQRLYRCAGRLVDSGIVQKKPTKTIYNTTENTYTLITSTTT